MTDIETCYKAFRAGVIKPLELTSSGFGMEVEITAMICKTAADLRSADLLLRPDLRGGEEDRHLRRPGPVLHRLLQPRAAVHGRRPDVPETGQRDLAELHASAAQENGPQER